MFVLIPDSSVIAELIGGWELILILAVVLILSGAKWLPLFMRELNKEINDRADDAGKSLGGIFGKRASELLTPNNEVTEPYDPAVFRKRRRRRSIRQFFRDLWRKVLDWFRIG